MMRKLRSLAVLLALLILPFVPTATRAATVPAPFIVGSDGQTVVLANGDVFQFGGLPQWNYFNNIFASSGRAQEPDNVPVASDGHSIFTSKGDWFEYSGPGWVWNNNVFESSGVAASPLDPVVGASFGSYPNAFTASGEWFSWRGPWVHSGNIFSGGAVPSKSTSWGAVKVRTR